MSGSVDYPSGTLPTRKLSKVGKANLLNEPAHSVERFLSRFVHVFEGRDFVGRFLCEKFDCHLTILFGQFCFISDVKKQERLLQIALHTFVSLETFIPTGFDTGVHDAVQDFGVLGLYFDTSF